jgi:hypothetical protein
MDLIKYKIYSNNFGYIMIQYFNLIYLFNKITRKVFLILFKKRDKY